MRDNSFLTGKELSLRDDQLIVSRADLQGRIVYANADFIEISGFSEEELIGQPHNIIRSPSMPAEVFADFWADLKAGRPWIGVIQNRCRNGDVYWVQAHVSPVWESGVVVGYLSMRRKADAAQIAEAAATYAAIREQRLNGRVFRHGRMVSSGSWARLSEALGRIPILFRFLLFTLLTALIVLGAMAHFLGAELSRELDADARSSLRYDVQLVTSALSTRIEAGRKETIDHARTFSERVASMLERRTGDRHAAIESLASAETGNKSSVIDELTRDLNGIGTVFVRSPEGFRRVVSTLSDELGQSVTGTTLAQDHPAVQKLLDGQSFVGTVRLFGRPYVTSYMPIIDRQGEVVGASFMGMDLAEQLNFFKSEIRGLKVGQTGYYYIIDTTPGPDFGTLMLHPFLEGKRVPKDGVLNDRDIVNEMLTLGRGEITYPWMNVEAGELEARDKLVVFQTLTEPRWIVAGGTSVHEFTSRSGHVVQYVVGGGLAMAAIIFVIILILLRRLVFKPLDTEVLPAFQAIAAGRYATRLNIHGSDEIAQVIQGLECLQTRLAFDAEQSRALALARETARQAAEDLTRARTEFLANMSHEIRTPMNAVIGFAHLLSKGDLGKREKDYVHRIESSGKLLLAVVNDILDFAKMDAGKLLLESAPFLLDEVLDNLSVLVRERVLEKQLSLEYVIAPGVPAAFDGDALRLSQVLINLVGNAIKFTEQGAVTVYVGSTMGSNGSVQLDFRIQDTGIGMTAEQADKLFQAFSQADTSITRRFGGTGLGLAISRRLIEMMGGSIKVDSQHGVGSVFSFSIKLQVAAQDAVAVRLPEVSVLVVDDNLLARTVLVRLLEKIGCRAAASASGVEALAMMADRVDSPFDCVLLDLNMPEMDGLTLAKRIRQQYGQQAKLVLVTASNVHDEELSDALEDFDAVLEKPVTAVRVAEVLEQRVVNAQQGSQKTPVQSENTILAGLRVLLAEDVPTNQLIMRDLLESLGASVDIAENGAIALDKLAAHAGETDLILMDIQMPVMDGLEACRKIRAGSICADIPIIALTAHALDEERQRTSAAGMNDFITKPIDPGHLLAVIQRWWQKSAAVAPVATQPAGESSEAFPEIDGVDVQDGLRRMMHRAVLYEKVLRDFHARFAGEAERIVSALAEENWDDAVRRAHSIKGLSGTIGAVKLATLARELEGQLRERNSDVQAGVEAFDQELKRVVEGIGKVLGGS